MFPYMYSTVYTQQTGDENGGTALNTNLGFEESAPPGQDEIPNSGL